MISDTTTNGCPLK